MSKSQLETNTATMQAILAAVNALPEEGGGGGGSIDTCTVVLTSPYGTIPQMEGSVCATIYTNGVTQTHYLEEATFPFPYSIENVVCGSPVIFTFYHSGFAGASFSCSGAEMIILSDYRIFKITAGAGETATISLTPS